MCRRTSGARSIARRGYESGRAARATARSGCTAPSSGGPPTAWLLVAGGIHGGYGQHGEQRRALMRLPMFMPRGNQAMTSLGTGAAPSQARARRVPDEAVGHELSQSLADSSAPVQTWIYAGEADQRTSLTRTRSAD